MPKINHLAERIRKGDAQYMAINTLDMNIAHCDESLEGLLSLMHVSTETAGPGTFVIIRAEAVGELETCHSFTDCVHVYDQDDTHANAVADAFNSLDCAGQYMTVNPEGKTSFPCALSFIDNDGMPRPIDTGTTEFIECLPRYIQETIYLGMTFVSETFDGGRMNWNETKVNRFCSIIDKPSMEMTCIIAADIARHTKDSIPRTLLEAAIDPADTHRTELLAYIDENPNPYLVECACQTLWNRDKYWQVRTKDEFLEEIGCAGNKLSSKKARAAIADFEREMYKKTVITGDFVVIIDEP